MVSSSINGERCLKKIRKRIDSGMTTNISLGPPQTWAHTYICTHTCNIYKYIHIHEGSQIRRNRHKNGWILRRKRDSFINVHHIHITLSTYLHVYPFIYVFVYICLSACLSVCTHWVGEQEMDLWGSVFFPPYEFQARELNSNHTVWQQVSLPANSSHWPTVNAFKPTIWKLFSARGKINSHMLCFSNIVIWLILLPSVLQTFKLIINI